MSDDDALRADFAVVVEDYEKDTPQQFLSRPQLRAIIWEKSNGRCWYCGKEMNPFRDFSTDHIVARCVGGGQGYDNLVPACRTCNASKNNRSLEQFRPTLARRCAGFPAFTKEQLAYLARQGVDTDKLLPFDDFQFYFEREGL